MKKLIFWPLPFASITNIWLGSNLLFLRSCIIVPFLGYEAWPFHNRYNCFQMLQALQLNSKNWKKTKFGRNKNNKSDRRLQNSVCIFPFNLDALLASHHLIMNPVFRFANLKKGRQNGNVNSFTKLVQRVCTLEIVFILLVTNFTFLS